MAEVALEIGGRTYSVACRDGEEGHLRGIAAMVDRKAQEATAAVGGVNEARQLLFAALLLADELAEGDKSAPARGATQPAEPDPAVAGLLERLAERVENLATRLETGAHAA